ncbi:MAG: MotA/TolQ/ExbB proton channel family protein [Candidatus Schekmanbacteria bacterium]|nr:MotA/TolQ/ExbB proton channel family protein [Candidatus Schekmanbacteria bacterium]
MKCPSCGTQNPDKAVRCEKCGLALSSTAYTQTAPAGYRQDTSVFTTRAIFWGTPGTTDVSVISTVLIGVLVTAVWYLIFPLPLLKGTYFHTIFTERSFIQHTITFFFFWSMAIIIFKFLQLKEHKQAFNMNIIPEGLKVITPKDALQLITTLEHQSRDPRGNILLNRIWLALEHYRSSGKAEKVDEILSYQGQVDADVLESSYTLFRVFVWAIPILGFIGTVLGMGGAIGGFSAFTKGALELDQIKNALDVITGGLSVAFDTTLLGLVCALFLMLPGTALQKLEESHLIEVERYCMDNLLNRFQVTEAAAETGAAISEESIAWRFKQIIEETFEKYLKTLQETFQTWSGGFGQVMETVSGQTRAVGEQFLAIKPVAEGFKATVSDFTGQLKGVAGQQAEMVNKLTAQLTAVAPLISNLNDIRSTMDQERKNFLEQANNWLQNLERASSNIVSKINDQQQQQIAGIKDVRSALEQERKAFVDQVNAWSQNLDRVGTNIMTKMTDQQHQQVLGLNELRNSLDQERRAFQDQANNWMRNLDQVGNDIIGKLSERQQLQATGQSKELQEVLQTFNSLVNKENEIINLINKNYEQMIASDRRLKETLDGVRSGLDVLRPSLEQIAKPKKVRLIEE